MNVTQAGRVESESMEVSFVELHTGCRLDLIRVLMPAKPLPHTVPIIYRTHSVGGARGLFSLEEPFRVCMKLGRVGEMGNGMRVCVERLTLVLSICFWAGLIKRVLVRLFVQ